MSITNKILFDVIGSVYGDISMEDRYDNFLDEIERNSTISFTVFRSVNDSLYDGDILILDNETNEFISWYKLAHIGRDLHTNIATEEQLRKFIKKFYDCNKEG